MKKLNIILFLIFICLLFFSKESLASTIPLIVTEPAGVARNNDPITYGIPLAQSDNITSLSSFSVTTDQAGLNKVDAQFRVLSRYNDIPNGTGPIRSVLLDFQNSIYANSTKTFYLQTSGGGGAASGMLAVYSLGDVIVNTGVMVANIDNATGWFSSVLIDADEDSVVDDQVLGSTGNDGFIVRSTGGVDYASKNSTVVIEENGPLRCVVKSTGYFKDSGNNTLIPAKADNGLEYTIRFSFFKNKKYVKVAATLKNENLAWTNNDVVNPTHPAYIDYGYLRLTSAVFDNAETVTIDNSAYTGLGTYSVSQNETDDKFSHSYAWQKTINGGEPTIAQFDGYLDTRDFNKGVMVGMRWFWQQYPKAFRASDGGDVVYVDLWPDKASDYTIPGGFWKTHELIFYFHKNTENDFEETLAVLQNRLIAKPSDVYVASTNFFYSIPPANISTDKIFHINEPVLQDIISQDNRRRRAKIDSDFIDSTTASYSLEDLRDYKSIPYPNGGFWTWYGWNIFGNLPRWSDGYKGYNGQHYDWSYSTLVDWLRFSDREYLDLAEELVSYKADILIMHDQHAYTMRDYGAKFHGGHRYEHDSIMSFYDTYSISEQNAPATGSHFWSKGIALQYLLTGDFRFKDALEDTVEGRIYNYFVFQNCTNDCSSNYTIRDKGRSFEGLLTGYLVLGNTDYLTKAHQIFNNSLGPKLRSYGSGEYYETISQGREASLLQSGTTIEPTIQLYYILNDIGDAGGAESVKNTALKQGIWYRDSVYPWHNCSGTQGTYSPAGQYTPYAYCKEWDKDSPIACDTCDTVAGGGGGYFTGRLYATDLFAFLYAVGYGQEWRTLADAFFKDEIVYGGAEPIEPVSIKNTMLDTEGWEALPSSGNSWAKDGQYLKKGLFYLQVVAGNVPQNITDITPPSAPSGLSVL